MKLIEPCYIPWFPSPEDIEELRKDVEEAIMADYRIIMKYHQGRNQ